MGGRFTVQGSATVHALVKGAAEQMPDYISRSKLRRLATRALRALERHKHSRPFLASFELTLVPTAQRYAALHDRISATLSQKNRESQQGHHQIGALLETSRGWLAPLARDLEKFNAADFRTTTNVPDDIIVNAERLLAIALETKAANAAPPYREQLIADLSAAIPLARAEWARTQQVLSNQQELQADLRNAGKALHAELVAFRSALRTALGSSHRDYQTLRTKRASVLDEEDEDNAQQADDSGDQNTDTHRSTTAPVLRLDSAPRRTSAQS